MIINDTIRHDISYRVHMICANKSEVAGLPSCSTRKPIHVVSKTLAHVICFDKFEVAWLASCCTKKPMHAISKTVAYVIFADKFDII